MAMDEDLASDNIKKAALKCNPLHQLTRTTTKVRKKQMNSTILRVGTKNETSTLDTGRNGMKVKTKVKAGGGKLFVGNLPYTSTDEDLRALLQ